MSFPSGPLQGNIVDYLFEHSLKADAADRPFMLLPDGEVSFKALFARACQAGNMLGQLGLQAGDRVLFSLLDGVDFVALFLGGMKVGVVSVPLSTFLSARDYGYYIRDSGAKLLVVDQSIAPLIREAYDAEALDARVLVVGADTCGFESFADAMQGQAEFVETRPAKPEDTAFWLYSSGSTGAPKGVVHTHGHLHAATELFGVGEMKLTQDDVIACPLKMFFAFGLGFKVYMPLRVGARVVVDPAPTRAPLVLDQVVRYQPTRLVAVPTLFTGLIDLLRGMDKATITQAFSRVRFSVSGGEVLAPSVIKEWKDITGTDILDGVGTTEMTHMFVINRPGQVVPGSCGRVVKGFSVRLVDDDWNDVPQGEVGNMYAVGPSAAREYWNKPERTAATMRDGGVLTGDKFYQDKDGNFFYVGRNDDMLRVGGIWVSPAEVESTLLEHPAISECAVIGVKDENALVKPKAYIVLRSGHGASAQLAEEIRALVRERLAHYKCPRWIEFTEDLPKTATGKIQRFKLRQMEEQAG